MSFLITFLLTGVPLSLIFGAVLIGLIWAVTYIFSIALPISLLSLWLTISGIITLLYLPRARKQWNIGRRQAKASFALILLREYLTSQGLSDEDARFIADEKDNFIRLRRIVETYIWLDFFGQTWTSNENTQDILHCLALPLLWSYQNVFGNEDEDAQFYLSKLQSGTYQEKAAARDALAEIFERKGLLSEAAECHSLNLTRGIRVPAIYEPLADLHRRMGDTQESDRLLSEMRQLRPRTHGIALEEPSSTRLTAEVPVKREWLQSLRWYFQPSLSIPLRLLVFFYFVFGMAGGLMGAIVQWLGLTRAVGAVTSDFNGVVWFLATGLVATTSWVATSIPLILYYSLFLKTPGLWKGEGSVLMKSAMFILIVVIFSVLAYFINEVIAFIIGWIADVNPCASFKAGVTGSIRPPSTCR